MNRRRNVDRQVDDPGAPFINMPDVFHQLVPSHMLAVAEEKGVTTIELFYRLANLARIGAEAFVVSHEGPVILQDNEVVQGNQHRPRQGECVIQVADSEQETLCPANGDSLARRGCSLRRRSPVLARPAPTRQAGAVALVHDPDAGREPWAQQDRLERFPDGGFVERIAPDFAVDLVVLDERLPEIAEEPRHALAVQWSRVLEASQTPSVRRAGASTASAVR